jgi:phage baseplate assembly protein V
MHKSLHIFRAGTHTAADGRSLTFSEADLAATAKAYDPKRHEAPLVVGHPEHDSPAFGWVSGLAAGPSGLSAVPNQVDSAFAEAVAQGRYKKISAAFYHPESAANPVPGVWYLRHVGFLGGMPPSVKGLAAPAFAGGAEDFVSVEFGEELPAGFLSRLYGMFRAMRDYLVERDGVERAQQYGFSSHPKSKAECFVVFCGAASDHPVILSVDDRNYRIIGSEPGEVIIYTDEGDTIHLKRKNIIEVTTKGDVIVKAGKTVDVRAGTSITLTSENIYLTAPNIHLNGSISASSGDGSVSITAKKFSVNADSVSLNEECE